MFDEALVRAGIKQYLITLYGGVPRHLNPGKDPLHFWHTPEFVKQGEMWNTEEDLKDKLKSSKKTPGKDTFSYVPSEDMFRKIARDLGIKPGHTVIHPYASDSPYRELLEKVGAKVDTMDLSVWSALRSGGRIGDAERLPDYVKKRYDHYFAFEPSSLFMGSAGPIRAILSLASALYSADRVHILYHHSPYFATDTHVDFETFFRWLKEHFNVDYVVREYKTQDGKVLSVATLTADDKTRRELMEFSKLLHRTVVKGLPKVYPRLVRVADIRSDKKATTPDEAYRLLDVHADRVVRRLARTRWKNRSVLDMLKGIGKAYYQIYLLYKF